MSFYEITFLSYYLSLAYDLYPLYSNYQHVIRVTLSSSAMVPSCLMFYHGSLHHLPFMEESKDGGEGEILTYNYLMPLITVMEGRISPFQWSQ